MKLEFMLKEGIANANGVVYPIGTLDKLREQIEKRKVFLFMDLYKNKCPRKITDRIGMISNPEVIVDKITEVKGLWVDVLCADPTISLILDSKDPKFLLNSEVVATLGDDKVVKGEVILRAVCLCHPDEGHLSPTMFREWKAKLKKKEKKEFMEEPKIEIDIPTEGT